MSETEALAEISLVLDEAINQAGRVLDERPYSWLDKPETSARFITSFMQAWNARRNNITKVMGNQELFTKLTLHIEVLLKKHIPECFSIAKELLKRNLEYKAPKLTKEFFDMKLKPYILGEARRLLGGMVLDLNLGPRPFRRTKPGSITKVGRRR